MRIEWREESEHRESGEERERERNGGGWGGVRCAVCGVRRARAACGGGVRRWRAAIALRKRYIVRGAAVLLYPA